MLGIGVGMPAAPELVPARQRRERVGVVQPHREVVHLLGVRHRSPAVAPPAGRELVDEQEVLEREHHVVRGVGRAVGPLQATPQGHGDGLLVLRHLPALVDVGYYVDHVSRTAVGGLHGTDQPADRRQLGVLGADRGRLEGAAVGADALEHVEHQRFLGQPFLDRRQVPRRHHRRQHRRLAERGDRLPGVALEVGQRVPLPHVAILGHHLRRRGCLRPRLLLAARERDCRRHASRECDQGQLPSLSHEGFSLTMNGFAKGLSGPNPAVNRALASLSLADRSGNASRANQSSRTFAGSRSRGGVDGVDKCT